MMFNGKKMVWAVLCAGAIAGGVGRGQTAPATQSSHDVDIQLAGRATARPAMEYMLIPAVEDTVHGNSVIHYHLAIELMVKVPPGQTTLNGVEKYDDKLDQLINQPLEQMDVDTATKIVEMQHNAMHELQNGARCDTAVWESSLRQDGMMTLLPYLGDLRALARVLTVSIRLDIRNHRWAEARAKLQTGYTIAHQLGEADTIIDSLVGLAIEELMSKTLQDWVRDPGSPNLFWPLVNLPHPFNNLQRPLANERAFVYFSFPQLKEMRDGKYSAQQWIDFVHGFSQVSGAIGNGELIPVAPRTDDPLIKSTAGTVAGMILYPEAKRYLVSRGMTAEEAERLPVATALGKYFERSYAEAGDAVFKWQGVPLWKDHYQTAEQELQKLEPSTNLLAKMLIPSLDRARFIGARADRTIDMLSILEAIRDYAAAHHALPDSLDAMELPLPADATTGKPFTYERQGDGATLSSDPVIPSGSKNQFTYHITLSH